ncbi:chromate efflux transporter [Planomonospora venezuelensis]|uniref:Chromate transporter n=1 Tax=Planomonospora venezuelensis TaxID=1999 RepID=A0A841DFH6_PLAVE|nr:chromate efflux transporter [Planomonospora venezuelensis]MBB5965996.1 chromate transporter [Planomonospora venezuelensis]GIN02340.1 chromate transporter [Planomonospora venezuelensis]
MSDSGGGPGDGGRPARPGRVLGEVAAVFLKLGVIGFGGPAAHIAMMREELVRRRGWVSDGRFLDLVGAASLIPGPNSTEVAIHLGHERARWRGLIVAGVCFIVPAFAIVLALAWAYVRHGRTPAAEGLLYGIKPVVVAIVVWALAGLLRTAVKGWLTGAVAAAALAAYLLGAGELLVLAAGGLVVMAVRTGRGLLPGAGVHALTGPLLVALPGGSRLADLTGGQPAQLFLTFLKIGSVLYGSGYVLLAFLEGDFVERLGWITRVQLLDAVSIGQVTPGPVFTTATFVGYVVAGLPGAVLATVGIFAPSFAFVALLTRIVDRVRDRVWSSAFLDGVNATALALMAGVTVELSGEAIVDPLTAVLAAAALLLQWRTRLNTAWLIAAAAAIGLARELLMG